MAPRPAPLRRRLVPGKARAGQPEKSAPLDGNETPCGCLSGGRRREGRWAPRRHDASPKRLRLPGQRHTACIAESMASWIRGRARRADGVKFEAAPAVATGWYLRLVLVATPGTGHRVEKTVIGLDRAVLRDSWCCPGLSRRRSLQVCRPIEGVWDGKESQ